VRDLDGEDHMCPAECVPARSPPDAAHVSRTAPLWGVGQRVFFLHDGRTKDLVQAILNHASAGKEQYGPSEANAVIANFSGLPASSQQDLLNFLRSL
jgi:CxxC motif-containing protein (DUF1111 family)